MMQRYLDMHKFNVNIWHKRNVFGFVLFIFFFDKSMLNVWFSVFLCHHKIFIYLKTDQNQFLRYITYVWCCFYVCCKLLYIYFCIILPRSTYLCVYTQKKITTQQGGSISQRHHRKWFSIVLLKMRLW